MYLNANIDRIVSQLQVSENCQTKYIEDTQYFRVFSKFRYGFSKRFDTIQKLK